MLTRLIASLAAAEGERDGLAAEATRRVFAEFDARFAGFSSARRCWYCRKSKWSHVVSCLATFDCLLSLARYAETSGMKMCVPEFVTDSSDVRELCWLS